MLSRKLLVLFVVGAVAVFALDAGERVSGFGKNEYRLLGLKESVVLKPENIPAFETKCILQADVAAARAIFVSCEGQVYMTGGNVGSTGGYTLTTDNNLETPAIVHGLSDHTVVMGAVGDHHAVVLTNSGRVFTWGANSKGQLGFGDSVQVAAEPTEILSLSRKNIRMIAAGGNRTAALSDDGRLYMWGEGGNGEMGDGFGKSHSKPTLVKSLNNNDQRVCQIAIGGSHVAAVTNAGDLYTWGNNNQGQLGLGEFGGIKKVPTPVGRLRKNACHVSTGFDFTSTITQDSRMFMWGSDGYPGPFEKTWFQGMKPRQAAAGKGHMVVLLANSSVVTWGSRKDGQAGRTFSGDFTLDPGFVDIDGVGQLAVGFDSTFLLRGSTPAPSLCPCLNEYYMYWRTKVEFQPTCKDGQSVCGDGSCCEEGSTCCRFSDGDVTSIVTPRAIDSRGIDSPHFKCVKSPDANCCDGYGCEKGFKCWGQPKCVPHWAHKGMGLEDLAERSSDPLSFRVPAKSPGFNPTVGVCGVRKVTCPDDSCCALGSTCCSKPDGSFGCCAHSNADCCETGCCREGYSCDNDRQTCVKKDSGFSIGQARVEGQCGSNKLTCPDRSCCASGKTCCVLNDGYFGCCPFTDGVCCSDGAGCCPGKHTCDVKNNKCVLQTRGEFGEDEEKEEVSIAMRSTPKNTPTRPSVSEVKCAHNTVCQYPGSCCESEGKSTCCDFINGTCCEGGLGCCPSGFRCDLANSKCSPESSGTPATQNNKQQKKTTVPMKFTRDAQVARPAAGQEKPVCPGKTQCEDNSCCPMGSSCCSGPNGQTTCCSSMTGVCCRNGGCCSEGDTCDDASYGCVSRNGEKYGHLSTQEPTKPSPSKKIRDVAAPGKCYADERSCGDGLCCPRSSTCCDGAFGQKSCCPASHGVCCGNGGCCPGGASCDLNAMGCIIEGQTSTKNGQTSTSGQTSTKMLMAEPANAAEAEWDIEECWDDEQSCAADGGCCLKSETCCGIHDQRGGVISACCPFKNGVCCDGGAGCCPQGSECDVEFGTCRKPGGEEQPLVASRGSAVHPLSGMSEKDCPDGSICNGQDTCCSVGFDDFWGEVLYSCCPFENAVCCSEFSGCCPNGYSCDAESRSCVTEGRTIPPADSAASESAANYVCLWPETQCPNGKCCDKDDVCAPTQAGSFRCADRGHVICGNGSHACPDGMFCDQRNGAWLCSVVEDTPETVKADMLKNYWGDDTEAACNSILLQTSTKQVVSQQKATAQFWYPKRLVVQSKAVKTIPTTLPTLLVAKICQHLNISGGSAAVEHCFQSNSNGHFVAAERERVAVLFNEYVRRVTSQRNTVALASETFIPQPEELDPCPCREKPTEKIENVESVAGSDDSVMSEVLESVASKESAEPLLVAPTDLVADDKVVTTLGMGKANSGSVPLSAETVVDDEEVKLVMDAMQGASSMESSIDVNTGDIAMKQAHKAETFMGKEGCDEDGAEQAVDLDTNMKPEEDGQEISLAQMNAQPTARSGGALMPEM